MDKSATIEDTSIIQNIPMENRAFYALTKELLDCVRDHEYGRLSAICDDDFGIVDINTTGGSQIIRDRAGWEAWFTGLFVTLDDMSAATWSDITGYESSLSDDMGYSVVDFDQTLVTPEQKLRFSVIATIIWKLVDGTWKEARYHSSLVSVVQI